MKISHSDREYRETFIGKAFDHYVHTALWSSTDDDGDPLDSNYDPADVENLDSLLVDVTDFVVANWDDVKALDPGGVGHNLWLSRNGHGAGFWDLGWGALGYRLHEAAKVYGKVDLMVTDDGRVYAAL